MKKNNRIRNFTVLLSVYLVSCCFFSFLYASPVVVKGVDGTWLPVLAFSWSEKSGGVIVKPVDSVDLSLLRNKLIENFPDMTIEIIGQTLFFPSTTVDTLFEVLNGVDVGITIPSEQFSKENMNKPVLKIEESISLQKDETLEAVINDVLFKQTEGILVLDVVITKRAEKGQFTKLSGKQKIEIQFKMKNETADTEDEKNRYFGRLLLSQKGTKILFIPERIEGKKNITIVRYVFKK